MSWVTWALILSGVGLNAAAQLLLKVATRPLGDGTRKKPSKGPREMRFAR